MQLAGQLKAFAESQGADFFGVADLSPAREAILAQGGPAVAGFPRAVSVGIGLAHAIVDLLPQRDQHAIAASYHYHCYQLVNQRLDFITSRLGGLLQSQGHRAFPVAASQRVDDEGLCGIFSHKMAAHLAGLASATELRASPLAGPLLENRILSGLLAWRETSQPRAEVHFWRTPGGAEVDFVIERGARLLPVEVKTAKRLQLRDLRHLDLFLKDYPKRAPFAVVLHDCDAPQQVTRRIIGLPLVRFL